MTQLVKFPGISTTIGGVEYIIPPIALRPLQQMQTRISQMSGQVDEASIETAVLVIHAALKRNYPEITLEKVGDELVDIGNMFELFEMVMDVSGLKRKALEASSGDGAGE